MEFHIDRKGRFLMQIYATALTLLLILSAIFFVRKELLPTVIKLIAVFGVFVTVTFLPLVCKRLVIRLEKGSLTVTTGILFNVKRIYFVDKTVRIKRFSLPISKLFGLSILYVHGLEFTFILPPLPTHTTDIIIRHFQL